MQAYDPFSNLTYGCPPAEITVNTPAPVIRIVETQDATALFDDLRASILADVDTKIGDLTTVTNNLSTTVNELQHDTLPSINPQFLDRSARITRGGWHVVPHDVLRAQLDSLTVVDITIPSEPPTGTPPAEDEVVVPAGDDTTQASS